MSTPHHSEYTGAEVDELLDKVAAALNNPNAAFRVVNGRWQEWDYGTETWHEIFWENGVLKQGPAIE